MLSSQKSKQYPTAETVFRHFRMYIGDEEGVPALNLFEIGPNGQVHRQAQIHSKGTRYCPEDILVLRHVDPDYMANHSASEEIDKREFEMLWAEVKDRRPFLERLPDPSKLWVGIMRTHKYGLVSLYWDPEGPDRINARWIRVPGFRCLFFHGFCPDMGLYVSKQIFLEKDIEWEPYS